MKEKIEQVIIRCPNGFRSTIRIFPRETYFSAADELVRVWNENGGEGLTRGDAFSILDAEYVNQMEVHPYTKLVVGSDPRDRESKGDDQC